VGWLSEKKRGKRKGGGGDEAATLVATSSSSYQPIFTRRRVLDERSRSILGEGRGEGKKKDICIGGRVAGHLRSMTSPFWSLFSTCLISACSTAARREEGKWRLKEGEKEKKEDKGSALIERRIISSSFGLMSLNISSSSGPGGGSQQ